MGLRSRRNRVDPNEQHEAEIEETNPYKPPVRPRATRVSLQYVPAYAPSYHPCCAIVVLLILTLFLLGAGIPLLAMSSNQPLFEIRYDSLCGDALRRENVADQWGRPLCISTFDFTVPERIPKPVYIKYRVDGVFLNHREFGDSRDDRQNAGNLRTLKQISRCRPFCYVGDFQDWESPSGSDYNSIYNPCGAIAWSMFNDSFTMYDVATGDTICDTSIPTALCSKDGISWFADKYVRYRQSTVYQQRYYSWPNDYADEMGHQLPNVNDQDTMNWMVASPQRDFRKMWRKLDADLEPGRTYRVVMAQRYDVDSFGGGKWLSFTTTSWAGGRNQAVGMVMVITGVVTVCLTLALACVWLFGRGAHSGDIVEALANH